MACPICREKKKIFSIYVRDYEYNIKNIYLYDQCKSCKTIYRKKPRIIKKNLENLYSKKVYLPLKGNILYDFLKKIYASYEKKEITKFVGNDFFKKKKTILDVACGKGYLIEDLSKDSNLKCFGSDISINTIKKNNVKFFRSSFDNTNIIKNISPDLIIINNFFEHVERPESIYKIVNKMKKKSYLIIITPDGNSLAKQKFLNYWSGFHAPRHKVIFNNKSIRIFFSKFKKIDFKQTKIHDPFSDLVSLSNAIKQTINKFYFSDFLKIFSFIFFIILKYRHSKRLLIMLKKI